MRVYYRTIISELLDVRRRGFRDRPFRREGDEVATPAAANIRLVEAPVPVDADSDAPARSSREGVGVGGETTDWNAWLPLDIPDDVLRPFAAPTASARTARREWRVPAAVANRYMQ